MTYLVEMTITINVGCRDHNSFKLNVFGSLKQMILILNSFLVAANGFLSNTNITFVFYEFK